MKIRIFSLILTTVCSFLLAASFGHSSPFEDSQSDLTFLFFTAKDPIQFIVVEKSSQKLMLFEQHENLKLLKTFTSVTGENPGTKLVSGDSRTPEGLYYITEIYEDNKITVFGSRAFHLDYPNAFDRQAGRLGDGIFIHGTNKDLIPYSTNGCITLDNSDLDDLAPYLTVNSIPVIVVDNLPVPLLSQNLRLIKNGSRFREILDELSVNSKDFSAGNIDSLYFIKRGTQAIASVSYSVYDGNFLQYRYQKRAYLTPAITKDWRTLYAVHSQAAVPSILALDPVKKRLTVVADHQDTPADSAGLGEELLAFVEKWRTAWANKDTQTYIDCYSPTFQSGRLDREGWKKKKTYLSNKYRYIKVAIRNIAVEWTESGANVSFYQDYQSDQYKISGTKFLQLINRDNKWMIQREIM